MKYSLGFIGCGNMGGALVRAAAKSTDGNKIAVCDFNEKKTSALANEYDVAICSAEELVKNSKFVVLGVKPQMMQDALSPLANLFQNRTDVTIVTMAAGLSIAAIRAMIGKDLPTIRIMPNTPVNLGEGMILYAAEDVSEEIEKEFLASFEKAGLFDKIPESEIDGAGALSGCGPAFTYAFAKAIANGAVACGIPQEKADKYAAQTVLGAAKMLLTYGDPDALIKAVCSPGGTTLAGMKALNDGEFEKIAASAVTAAYERTLELKKS